MGQYAQSYIDDMARKKLASGKPVDWENFKKKVGVPSSGIIPIAATAQGPTAATPTNAPVDQRPAPTEAPMVRPDGSLDFGAFINKYESAYKAAKDANEQRYKSIDSGYTDRFKRIMGNLEGMGLQEAADIRDSAAKEEATNQARLNASGLGNTSIAASINAASQRRQNADLGRLNERLRAQQAGMDAQLSGDQLQFQERREDVYPDMGLFANLAQMMGQGGFGVGGGGGSVGGGGGNVGGGGAVVGGVGGGGMVGGGGAVKSPTDIVGYKTDWSGKSIPVTRLQLQQEMALTGTGGLPKGFKPVTDFNQTMTYGSVPPGMQNTLSAAPAPYIPFKDTQSTRYRPGVGGAQGPIQSPANQANMNSRYPLIGGPPAPDPYPITKYPVEKMVQPMKPAPAPSGGGFATKTPLSWNFSAGNNPFGFFQTVGPKQSPAPQAISRMLTGDQNPVSAYRKKLLGA